MYGIPKDDFTFFFCNETILRKLHFQYKAEPNGLKNYYLINVRYFDSNLIVMF